MSAGTAARVTVLVFAAALALTGCGAPPSPASNDSKIDPNSPQNEPNTPAIVTLADTVPVPFVDLDCAGLVPTAVAQAALKKPVVAQPVVLSQGYLLTDGLPSVHEPMTFATQIDGGFTCEWSNGESQILDVAQNPAYAGAILDVLPNATAAWGLYLDYLQTFDGKTQYCEAYDTADCQIDELIDGTWYSLRTYQVNVAANAPEASVVAAARPILDAAAASVAAATPKTGTPGVLSGTAALSDDCNQFFSAAELDAAAGVPLTLDPQVAGGQIFTFGSAAKQAADVDYCSWHLTSNENYYNMAMISWLEGGEWAFAKLQSGNGFANATEIDVPGLSGKETAYVECVDGNECSVDILVSHDWVWFSIWLNSTVSAVTPEAAAAAIAAKIAAKIG
jgi:hypothetical protein